METGSSRVISLQRIRSLMALLCRAGSIVDVGYWVIIERGADAT
jgi:hypothetical protein